MKYVRVSLIVAIIIVCCLIAPYLYPLLWTETVKETYPSYTLGLLAIAKNEGMVIEEFVQHYLWQGVDKIYLIDNGSTDDMRSKLEPYIASGKVDYYFKSEQNRQAEHYNYVYHRIKDECMWLVVCDVDEYIYNTQGGTIKSYLDTLSYEDVGIIYLNWKMFGSSGYVQQPTCIRKSFLYRSASIHPLTKAIVNTKHTTSLNVHTHYVDDAKHVIHQPPELALNHYAIMSKEYFQTVKMTRGDAADSHLNSFRDMAYFERYDTNEAFDDELLNILNNASLNSDEIEQ